MANGQATDDLGTEDLSGCAAKLTKLTKELSDAVNASRDDTHVYCNQQGAAAAPAETNVSGTGGDSDSPDDTGSTESATEMNDTGTRTPREADDIDVPDTGHDDLSGHMRQPEFPAAHDHSLDTQVLHWRETCAQATQGGAAF